MHSYIIQITPRHSAASKHEMSGVEQLNPTGQLWDYDCHHLIIMGPTYFIVMLRGLINYCISKILCNIHNKLCYFKSTKYLPCYENMRDTLVINVCVDKQVLITKLI